MYARKSSSHRSRSAGPSGRIVSTSPTLARSGRPGQGHPTAYALSRSTERSVRVRGGRIALSIGLERVWSGLLGGGLIDGALGRLLDGLLDGALAGRRTLGALLGEQLVAPLGGDGRRVVVLAERRVRLAVGDVRAEAAVLDDDGLAADGVGAELLERRRRRGPPALLGLGVDRERLVEG